MVLEFCCSVLSQPHTNPISSHRRLVSLPQQPELLHQNCMLRCSKPPVVIPLSQPLAPLQPLTGLSRGLSHLHTGVATSLLRTAFSSRRQKASHDEEDTFSGAVFPFTLGPAPWRMSSRAVLIYRSVQVSAAPSSCPVIICSAECVGRSSAVIICVRCVQVNTHTPPQHTHCHAWCRDVSTLPCIRMISKIQCRTAVHVVYGRMPTKSGAVIVCSMECSVAVYTTNSSWCEQQRCSHPVMEVWLQPQEFS